MTTPTVQPALQRLLDLVDATRPDLAPDRRKLEGLICGHRDAGCPWSKILVQTALICAHGDGLKELDLALTDPSKAYRRGHR